MKKIFISQPMRGRTNEEIKNERMEIKNQMEDYFKEGIEVLDSFFEDAPHDAKPVWYLAKSLEVMSNADVVVFAEGWDKARGCIIEHAVASSYGLRIFTIFKSYEKLEDNALLKQIYDEYNDNLARFTGPYDLQMTITSYAMLRLIHHIQFGDVYNRNMTNKIGDYYTLFGMDITVDTKNRNQYFSIGRKIYI